MIPLLVQPISNEESTNILPVPWIRFHRCRFHGIDRLAYIGRNFFLPVCRLLCRFSDAGMTKLSPGTGGRRPKSAKARNRGRWGTDGAVGAMGILPRARAWEDWTGAVAVFGFLSA